VIFFAGGLRAVAVVVVVYGVVAGVRVGDGAGCRISDGAGVGDWAGGGTAAAAVAVAVVGAGVGDWAGGWTATAAVAVAVVGAGVGGGSGGMAGVMAGISSTTYRKSHPQQGTPLSSGNRRRLLRLLQHQDH